MKIAIFTDVFFPKNDGCVTATINLAKGLSDRGHKVFIIAPKYKTKKEFYYKNVIVKRVSSIPAFYPGVRLASLLNFKIYKFLKKNNIEIAHFQTPLSLGLNAIVFSKLLNIPLVGTFHTFFADKQYLKHVNLDYTIIEKIAWSYSKFFYNRCDLISCPSNFTKNLLINKKFSSCIKAISNGINPNIFDNSQWRKIRQQYNPNGPLLLFIGRLAHEKNLNYLIDCFLMVLKKLPEAKLLIIGGGPQKEEIQNKITQMKLEKEIILAGEIPHKKLVKSSIFKACDLFVTASTTENQPMTILEAQVNGLPCVVIEEKGMKDLVKNGYNGYLVKNGDKKAFSKAIFNIITNKKLMNKMKNNTIKEIKKHHLNSTIERWEQEYQKLIIQKNKGV